MVEKIYMKYIKEYNDFTNFDNFDDFTNFDIEEFDNNILLNPMIIKYRNSLISYDDRLYIILNKDYAHANKSLWLIDKRKYPKNYYIDVNEISCYTGYYSKYKYESKFVTDSYIEQYVDIDMLKKTLEYSIR